MDRIRTGTETKTKKYASMLIAVLAAAALVIPSAARENASVEAAYFNVRPEIDGVISYEEWGQPTGSALVYTGKNDYRYDDNDYFLASDYCFFRSKAMYVNDISFDFWLRWDEQYFYIGVVSKDRYGLAAHYNPETGEDNKWYYMYLWDGDALQFGIDPAGANSGGDPTNPFLVEFPFNTFVFGFEDQAMTKAVLRNDANMSELVPGYKGGITWSSGVWPSFGGAVNTEEGYTTFEVAVPYAAFAGNIEEGKTNGFGVAISRVSATPVTAVDPDGNLVGTGTHDCDLSWGDGLMASLKEQPAEYRCGTNSVLLVDTPALGAGASGTGTVPDSTGDVSVPETSGVGETDEEADAAAEEPEEVPDAEGHEDTEEPAAAETEETENNAEEVTEDAENAEETEEEKADGAEDPADAEEKTEAEAEDKAIGGAEDAAKSGFPVGAVIGIAAAAVIAVGAVLLRIRKKKK